MAKSRLAAALANEKGVDFRKVVQKRKQKEAIRQKRKAGKLDTKKSSNKLQKQVVEDDSEDDDDDWEEEEDDDDEDEEASDADSAMGGLIDDEAEEGSSDEDGEEDGHNIDFAKFEHDESSSDSEVELEEKINRPKKAKQPDKKQQPESESEDDEEEEEEVIDLEDLEDLEDDEREDLVPHTRTTINNHTALLASLSRIGLPTGSAVPFATHQSVVSSKPTADSIPDIQDDLARELAFYAQALEAAKLGRAALIREGVPFSRPNDYFAEMVKSDGQMEKVKARLVEEATSKKAAAEARKQRDLKKFGKQVQVAKEQERAKAKRETLEKIKTLKRKRQEGSASALGAREDDDLFDVAVDNEISSHDKKRGAGKRPGAGREGQHPAKRQKKDAKYGFGGKKRHSKSGDAVSSGDMTGFSVKRMKAGGGRGKGKSTPRMGKNRRKAAAGKR